MSKFKFLLSFVFAFVFFTGAYAGEDLEAAVIVKKNGQKIECFIGRQTMFNQMVKKVSYKSDLNSSKQSIDIKRSIRSFSPLQMAIVSQSLRMLSGLTQKIT